MLSNGVLAILRSFLTRGWTRLTLNKTMPIASAVDVSTLFWKAPGGLKKVALVHTLICFTKPLISIVSQCFVKNANTISYSFFSVV